MKRLVKTIPLKRRYMVKIYDDDAHFKANWSIKEFMMKESKERITQKQLEKISTLSRIEIPRDEQFIRDLNQILSWQGIIKEIDIPKETPAMYTPFNQEIEDLVAREDIVQENLGKQLDYSKS